MRFLLLFFLLPALWAQQPERQDWSTKTIQLKYLDPEQLRSLYSGRSFVMQANRELKILTVTGPAQFLNEVEQTAKNLDAAPPASSDLEITIYLLASDAQASSLANLPNDVQAMMKTLVPAPPAGFGLADLKSIRVGDGQPAEIHLGAPGSSAAGLARISFQSAAAIPSARKGAIALTGLRCWLAQSSTTQAPADSDFTANLNLADGQAVLVARSGVQKPLLVIVRAALSR